MFSSHFNIADELLKQKMWHQMKRRAYLCRCVCMPPGRLFSASHTLPNLLPTSHGKRPTQALKHPCTYPATPRQTLNPASQTHTDLPSFTNSHIQTLAQPPNTHPQTTHPYPETPSLEGIAYNDSASHAAKPDHLPYSAY